MNTAPQAHKGGFDDNVIMVDIFPNVFTAFPGTHSNRSEYHSQDVYTTIRGGIRGRKCLSGPVTLWHLQSFIPHTPDSFSLKRIQTRQIRYNVQKERQYQKKEYTARPMSEGLRVSDNIRP